MSASRKAEAALVALTLYWGMTFVVVKDALAFASPLVFVALRFGVGGLALSLVAWRGFTHRPTVYAGLLLGLFLFLGFGLQTAGLQWTTPSRSAFLTGLSVLLVPVVSLLLFRRAPSLTSWAGVALAAVGLFVLTGGIQPNPVTGRGDLMSLGCALAYGFHITLTSYYSPRTQVTTLVAVQLGTVALLATACLPLTAHQLISRPQLWAAVLYTGLIGSAAAISLQSWAQARTSAVRAAVIFALEPVFAALFSLALGRERLGMAEWGGGGLVVLGVLVAEVGGAWLRV